MSGLNLEDLHKKLYKNTIKIRSIEKENKSIVDSINLLIIDGKLSGRINTKW